MRKAGRTEENAARQLADDLSLLLAGQMTEQQLREAWQRPDGPAVLETIWVNLEHYLADTDIRARDEAYRQMQDTELTKLIRLLREGGSENSLRRITFLRSSGL